MASAEPFPTPIALPPQNPLRSSPALLTKRLKMQVEVYLDEEQTMHLQGD